MKNTKKIFLITILSLAFIFGMFGRALAASDTPLTDQANVALQKAEADLDAANAALVAANVAYFLDLARVSIDSADNELHNLKNRGLNFAGGEGDLAAFVTFRDPLLASIQASLTAAKGVLDLATTFVDRLTPPASTIFSIAFTGSKTTLNTAINSANLARTAALNVTNSADALYAANSANHALEDLNLVKITLNAAIANSLSSLSVAVAQANVDAAKDALAAAKAGLDPAVAADAVAVKSSLGGLQTDASRRLNPAGISNPAQLIGRFINMLLAFIGSISLVLYIVAGFLWMTASGNTEKVTKAKSIMVWTTLGIVVMLASYMLVSLVFNAILK